MLNRAAAAVAFIATAVSSQAATAPTIISRGPEEFVGGSGRLTSIATDSRNQPHIVCDGGSYAYFYDRIGAGWQASSFNLLPTGHNQFYNPHSEIDSADTMFVSGIVLGRSMGLGVFVRRNVATAPVTTLDFERVGGKGFDCGNLSIDPNEPGKVVLSSSDGKYLRCQVNAGGTLDVLGAGAMYAGQGGEKNGFWISKKTGGQNIWHGCTGGWDGYPSAYNNSTRGGAVPVPWASFNPYRNMADDGTYVDIVSDLKDINKAYMSADFSNGSRGPKLGVGINIYNGSGMVMPTTALFHPEGGSYSGLRRFAPQLAAAKDGGAWVVYAANGEVHMRYVGQDGQGGPVEVVGTGDRANVCTDKDGNVHIVWNSYAGIKYRKFSVAGSASTQTLAGDYDGDGIHDIAIFRPSNGTWYLKLSNQGVGAAPGAPYDRALQFGAPTDQPVPADYDGDGRLDPAIYRAATGQWFMQTQVDWSLPTPTGVFQNVSFGSAEDTPVPADYDGDGDTDIALFRARESKWFFNGVITDVVFGAQGDLPIPGRYGAGPTAQIAVFRPSTAEWIVNGGGAFFVGTQFGSVGDRPVPADFTGDGVLDVAVFRPSTGQWLVQDIGTGGVLINLQFGSPTDTPAPGRYISPTGAVSVAVVRPSSMEWYIRQADGSVLLTQAPVVYGSQYTDNAVPADYDGDGKADVAVYRRNTAQWFVKGGASVQYGAGNVDSAVPGDYDGDGDDDVAVYRSTTGQWIIPGQPVVTFGAAGLDWPARADYDGDGKTDIAVFRPTTAQWIINGLPVQTYGAAYLDWPVPGDYDGDGTDEIAVFRPTTAQWIIPTVGVVQFGAASFDYPAPADYDGDGTTDFAVYRRVAGSLQWFIRKSSDGRFIVGSPPQWGSQTDTVLGAR